MANEYLVGRKVWLEAKFTDDDGNPDDPPDVTLLIERPSGTVETVLLANLQNTAVGTYKFRDTVADSGRTWYRFETSDGRTEQDYYLGRRPNAVPA
jgi:hypothetical protein